jgi:hypothetical protein
MSHPEEEGHIHEDVEREPRFTLSVTRKQIEVLLIAVQRDLTQSHRTLERVSSPVEHPEDYDILVRHFHELEALRDVLAAPLNG